MQESKRTFHFRLMPNVITLILVAVIAVGAYAYFTGHFGIRRGETKITSRTIKNTFEHTAELATEEYHFSNADKYQQKDKQLFGLSIPLTGKFFILTYSGTVTAGIRHFDQAKVSLSPAGKKVKIVLPRVEILSTHIDTDSVEVLDETKNIFNQISVKDVTSFQSKAEKEARKNAKSNGLLQRSEQRAKELVRSQVQALVGEEYEVIVSWQRQK